MLSWKRQWLSTLDMGTFIGNFLKHGSLQQGVPPRSCTSMALQRIVGVKEAANDRVKPLY